MLLLSHRAQLMAGGALFALFSGGYGQRAYAQSLTCNGPDEAGFVTCTGDGDVSVTFEAGNFVTYLDGEFTVTPGPTSVTPDENQEDDGIVLASTVVNVPGFDGQITSGGDIGITSGPTTPTVANAAPTDIVDVNGDLTVEGDIAAENSAGAATITITGNASAGGAITATDNTIYSGAGASIAIGGNATAGDEIRAESEYSDATVAIGGDATAGDDISARTYFNNASISISGDADAGGNIRATTTYGQSNLVIGGGATAGGDISMYGRSGYLTFSIGGDAIAGRDIDASSSAGFLTISVDGDATVGSAIRGQSTQGSVDLTITGDASAGYNISLYAFNDQVIAQIGGNLSAENGVRISGDDGAQLTVGRNVTSNRDVSVTGSENTTSITVGGNITVGGGIEVNKYGVPYFDLADYAAITIGGNAVAGEGISIDAGHGQATLSITGNAAAGNSIDVETFFGSSTVAIGSNVETGGDVRASSNYGSSTIEIDGDVDAAAELVAISSNGGASVTIGGNVTTGGDLRVVANGEGPSLSITGDATVGGEISVRANRSSIYGTRTDVTLGGSVTTVDGLNVFNPTDNITIDVTGDVTRTGIDEDRINYRSGDNAAIYAYGGANALGQTSVSITNEAGTITGAHDGIYARTDNGGDIDINVHNVSAERFGIGVYFLHSGATYQNPYGSGVIPTITVNSTGLVQTTTGNGVDVYTNLAQSSRIEISVNDIQAGAVGIQSYSASDQVMVINVTGDVVGGLNADALNGDGIALLTETDISPYLPGIRTVNISGSVSSARDDQFALTDYSGETTVNLYDGGQLLGRSRLGFLNDNLYAQGADLSQSGEIDGGRFGTDRVVIFESTDVIGTNLINFEEFSVGPDLSTPPDGFVANDEIVGGRIAQFASEDTLTLEGEIGQAFVSAGNTLSGGETLTIAAAQGIELDSATDVPTATGALGSNNGRLIIGGPLATVTLGYAALSGGILRTGGAAGASQITVNATGTGRGVTGGGTIDMQNGAVGDQVVVNGSVNLASRDGAGDILRVDIDQAVDEGDLLTVRDDLRLSGNIDVNVINIDVLDTTVTDHVIARSLTGIAGLAEGDDSVLTASTESIAAEVEARFEGQNVVVQVTTDFTPDADNLNVQGLSGNGAVFGEYLNEVLNDPALADVLATVLSARGIEGLDEIYDQLDGSALNTAVASAGAIGADFASSLFSCAVGEGQFAAIDEGQCTWTRVGAQFTDQRASGGNAGSNQTVFSVSAGGQMEVTENMRLGAGIGFASLDSNSDNGLKLDGYRASAGLSAKYVMGPFLVGASLGGGVTFSDSDRATGGQVARADFETYDLSALARAAYLYEAGGGLYIKPQLQAGVTFVHREAFTESGAGGANLAVASSSETIAHVSPSLEFGGDFAVGGTIMRPYLRIGGTVLSKDSVETTARFAAAGVGTNFTSSVERDNLFGDLSVGATVFSGDDISVRAEYQGRFSENTTSHGGFLKLQFNF